MLHSQDSNMRYYLKEKKKKLSCRITDIHLGDDKIEVNLIQVKCGNLKKKI